MSTDKILHQGNGVFKCKSQGSHKWTDKGWTRIRPKITIHYLAYSRNTCPHGVHSRNSGFFAHDAVLYDMVTFERWCVNDGLIPSEYFASRFTVGPLLRNALLTIQSELVNTVFSQLHPK